MINKPRLLMSGAAVAAAMLLSCAVASAQDMSDQESKLKSLENAMKGDAPAAAAAPKKTHRTRSIVFEADGDSAAAPAAAAAAPAGRISDCKAIPPGAKVTPVDFAIQFKSGRAEIAPGSEDTLRQIGKILSLSPDRCIVVEGHTDSAGSLDQNMALSKDRSVSVVKFIVEKAGLDASRLVPVGKGPTEPLSNLDPRDAKNRRVVFKVVG
jgi:outer membrane protein OmpA-like peptidoglycan-associated protein